MQLASTVAQISSNIDLYDCETKKLLAMQLYSWCLLNYNNRKINATMYRIPVLYSSLHSAVTISCQGTEASAPIVLSFNYCNFDVV